MSVGAGEPERGRPLGITVLAVVAGIGCVGGIVVALAVMGGGGVVRGGVLAFVVVPVVIALAGAAAYGLWTMRWWAWQRRPPDPHGDLDLRRVLTPVRRDGRSVPDAIACYHRPTQGRIMV